MRAKKSFTVWSFLLVLIFNGILIGGLYYMAGEVLDGLRQWIAPLIGAEATEISDDARIALGNMNSLIIQAQIYLAPVVLGGGSVLSLLLWLLTGSVGRRGMGKAAQEALASAAAQQPAKSRKAKTDEAAAPPEPRYALPTPGAAVQMLSILQRDGRFIDFLQEDLTLYDDTQIGAAVRSIHEGCKDAIKRHMELKPIMEETEGFEVTVPAGFDASAVRLTGSVSGDPPFRGILKHKGWRITKIQLPLPTTEPKEGWVLAPAEVEVSE